MKSYNNFLLKKFYESLIFLYPKSLYNNTEDIHSVIAKKWILNNSSWQLTNLKKMFLFLYKLERLRKATAKKKYLFIIDEELVPFFYNIIKDKSYIVTDMKNGFDLIYRSELKKRVIGLVYIGSEEFPYALDPVEIPYIGFNLNTKYKMKFPFEYYNPTIFSSHCTLLFLKITLAEALK